jgi:hypothetical protein
MIVPVDLRAMTLSFMAFPADPKHPRAFLLEQLAQLGLRGVQTV